MAIAEDTTSSERWFLPYWCCYALFSSFPWSGWGAAR